MRNAKKTHEKHHLHACVSICAAMCAIYKVKVAATVKKVNTTTHTHTHTRTYACAKRQLSITAVRRTNLLTASRY